MSLDYIFDNVSSSELKKDLDRCRFSTFINVLERELRCRFVLQKDGDVYVFDTSHSGRELDENSVDYLSNVTIKELEGKVIYK